MEKTLICIYTVNFSPNLNPTLTPKPNNYNPYNPSPKRIFTPKPNQNQTH